MQRIELRFYRDDGAVFAALQAGALNGAYFANGLGHDAQAWVRSQDKWKHPAYWAAWTLWGLPQ